MQMGKTLDPVTSEYKSTREMVEQHKRSMKVSKLTAKKELSEEQAVTGVSEESDYEPKWPKTEARPRPPHPASPAHHSAPSLPAMPLLDPQPRPPEEVRQPKESLAAKATALKAQTAVSSTKPALPPKFPSAHRKASPNLKPFKPQTVPQL